MKYNIVKCTGIFHGMRAARSAHDDLVEDVQSLIMPFRGDISGALSPDVDRTQPTFDATGVVALHALTSYLQGTIFSPTDQWLRFGLPGMASPDIQTRRLLDAGAQEVMAYLDDSNFYVAMNMWLKDLAGIGNACLLTEVRGNALRDDGSILEGLDFEAVPFNRIWRTLDRFGRPLAVAREVSLGKDEAEEFFGVRVAEADKNQTKICFRNLIKKDGETNHSYWWRDSGEDFVVPVEELPFMPYSPAMWDRVDGQDYGYGQGMLVRPCIAGMQELARQTIQAAGRELNPLLAVEHDSFMDSDVGNNGIVTLKRSITREPRFISSESNFQAADMIRRLDEKHVERAFFADALFPPESQERSAEATRARISNIALRMAGPAQNITLHLSEIVGLIVRVIRLNGGLVMLDEIGAVKPVFVSAFFNGAKQQQAERINTFVAQQAQIAALVQEPSFMDRINMSKAAEVVANNSDVPASILRTEEEVAAMAATRAKREADSRLNEQAQAGRLPGYTHRPGGEASTELSLDSRNLPGV